ncbi:hypothetical protein [Erwinia sp. S38]|uniref:hypothetical protein n=1 Tax=Erwinia sp. S38 TaxID=2769338 RepID=UPI00190A2DCA|nr:hypothetical protein [Erwinia sp. S38]MBK0003355.1 hypothetical protein [Erwinia sp. S38]
MRIVLDATINNPDLPLINPSAALISDTMVAGYNMLSTKDFSGRGNDFSWNGTFDASGAVLLNDPDHVMTLPFADTPEMTVIFCWNLATATAGGNRWLYGNGKPGSTAVSIKDGIFHRATGATVSLGVGATDMGTTLVAQSTGAWTLQAHRYSSTLIERITRSGGITSQAVTARNAGTGPFYVNGQPSSLSPAYASGGAGTIGMMLFYNELTDDATLASRMATVWDIMTSRGISVP